MDDDAFWALMDDARDRAAADSAMPSASDVGATLMQRLRALPLQDIVEFDARLSSNRAAAFSWEACAAAYVIWGRISDDGMEDFVGGLLAQGRATFATVTNDVDALAAVPLVQSIARGETDPFALAGEAVNTAASAAYAAASGDEEAFWLALDQLPDASTLDRWRGPFGSADDAAAIPSRLPQLSRLFRYS